LPVFIAFAAFLLLVYGDRLGLPTVSWFSVQGLFRSPRKSAGQKSGVRTDCIEMVLDHDSGRMDGRCLKGRFAGRDLSSLGKNELLRLLEELRSTDSQGALLLDAYLDRRCQGWRDSQSGNPSRDEPRRPADPKNRMTTKDAYDVLGLKTGASEAEIRSAHRRLMMKLHPDQGGSTYLASRINEAKEALLKRK
jgi:hypothetical protein